MISILCNLTKNIVQFFHWNSGNNQKRRLYISIIYSQLPFYLQDVYSCVYYYQIYPQTIVIKDWHITCTYKIIGLFACINRYFTSIGINCLEYILLPVCDVVNKIILMLALDNIKIESRMILHGSHSKRLEIRIFI